MEISKDVADSKIKLNLGCGKKVLDGYINIDIVSSPKAAREPEILCDLRKLTLEDDYADEAIAIHVIEHLLLILNTSSLVITYVSEGTATASIPYILYTNTSL